MIAMNELEQSLQCNLCGELKEISRKTMASPLRMLILMESFRLVHEPCEEFAGDPARALIERGYRLRMAAEMRGLK
jgi:hypothetical protein